MNQYPHPPHLLAKAWKRKSNVSEMYDQLDCRLHSNFQLSRNKIWSSPERGNHNNSTRCTRFPLGYYQHRVVHKHHKSFCITYMIKYAYNILKYFRNNFLFCLKTFQSFTFTFTPNYNLQCVRQTSTDYALKLLLHLGLLHLITAYCKTIKA